MVTPVQSVVRRDITQSNLGYVVLRQRQIGSRQKRPINLTLAYDAWYGSCAITGIGGGAGTDAAYSPSDALAYFGSAPSWAANRSYDKMRSELYSQASLGASLAEYSQALQMITTRGKQLLEFSRALKRFDVSGAYTALAIPPRNRTIKKYKHARSYGANWLEFHFGWRPLVNDIYESCMVLQNPINTVWAKGRATEPVKFNTDVNYGPFRDIVRFSGTVSSVQGISASISNPNAFLANSLGLTNPASILWEVTPFSFLLDWFSTVGQVLNSMTDFTGMNISSTFSTRFIKYRRTVLRVWSSPSEQYRNGSSTTDIAWTVRQSGLVTPILMFRRVKLPSHTRAATSISLLTQFLGRQARRGP